MIRFSSLLALLTLLLAWFPSIACSQETELTKGKILSRKYDFAEAGKSMRYSLYVPTRYDPQKKAPLVVALHGLGSNAAVMIRYPGFTREAEKHGYLVVAPTGYNSRGWYGSRGKGGGRGSDPDNLGELSEKDVMNVLEIIRKEFNIDENRIYLMGHSMGGGGTWHLGSKYPDIWAALGPIAPAAPRNPSRLETMTHIPVIVIQGDKDGLVHGARRWVAKMKELQMEYEYLEIEGGGHVDVAFKHFPELFAFFNAHPKGVQQEDAPAHEPQGLQAERFEGFKQTPVVMDYLVHLPGGYTADKKKTWPMILFLHGAGSVGNDIDRVKRNGLPQLLESSAETPARQFIVISPQTGERRWSASSLDALLTHVLQKYQVDPQRVYLTGLSLGGYGTWSLASRYPKRFAAIVPICGGGRESAMEPLKDLPVWVFHGAKDEIVSINESERLVEALQAIDGNVKFTVYPEADHDAWTETYNNPQLYQWLLQQKRSN
ncbi:MAG: prolyl oligopeptidase family serine peptidase [Mariniblastus sp.]|nr:prolyl oligopeptidase family serine peptidase [Mariniblastus sp.]